MENPIFELLCVCLKSCVAIMIKTMQNNLCSIHSWSVDSKWQQNMPMLVAWSFSSCLLPPLSLSHRTYANRHKAAIPSWALVLGSAFYFSALFSPVAPWQPRAGLSSSAKLALALALLHPSTRDCEANSTSPEGPGANLRRVCSASWSLPHLLLLPELWRHGVIPEISLWWDLWQ